MEKRKRQFRESPFCWQSKEVLRQIKKKYPPRLRPTRLSVYLALTQIESDFGSEYIRNYSRTISSYCGVNRNLVSKILKEYESLGILSIENERDKKGRFVSQKVTLMSSGTLTTDGSSTAGLSGTVEDSFNKNIKEESIDISLSKESLGNEELPPPKEEPIRSESPRSRESLLQAIALWKKEIEYLGLPPKVTTVDYVKLSAFLKERGYGNWKWLLDYMFWDKSSPFYREKKLTIAPYIRTLLADAFVGLWAMNGESEERKAKYDSM